MKKRFPVGLIVLLLLALFLAGGNNVPAPPAAAPADQVVVDAAVEATLTAVADSGQEENAEPVATPTPAAPDPESTATPDAPQQGDDLGIIMPPTVPDFQPLARPAASKGDPEAPVVIYEWSDYT